MSQWGNKTPKAQRPEQPNKDELDQKQVAFLKAIHDFSEDKAIKKLCDDRIEEAVATIVKLADTLSPYNYKGNRYYEVKGLGDVERYFAHKGQVEEFFLNIGRENNHQPIRNWDKQQIATKAREYFSQNMCPLRDIFKNLAAKEKLAGKLKFQISNTLQDLAIRDPGDSPVTTGTVGELLSQAHIPEGSNQQDMFFTSFQRDLEKATESLKDGSKLKTLIGQISDAAKNSGLFTAIDNLLGGKTLAK